MDFLLGASMKTSTKETEKASTNTNTVPNEEIPGFSPFASPREKRDSFYALSFFKKDCYCNLTIKIDQNGYLFFGEIFQKEKMKLLLKIFSAKENENNSSGENDDSLLDFRYFWSKRPKKAEEIIDYLHIILSERLNVEGNDEFDSVSRDFLYGEHSIGDPQELNLYLSRYEFSLRLISKDSQNQTGIALNIYSAHQGLHVDDPYFSLTAIDPTAAHLIPTTQALINFIPSWSKLKSPLLPPLPQMDSLRVMNVGQGNFVMTQN